MEPSHRLHWEHPTTHIPWTHRKKPGDEKKFTNPLQIYRPGKNFFVCWWENFTGSHRTSRDRGCRHTAQGMSGREIEECSPLPGLEHARPEPYGHEWPRYTCGKTQGLVASLHAHSHSTHTHAQRHTCKLTQSRTHVNHHHHHYARVVLLQLLRKCAPDKRRY